MSCLRRLADWILVTRPWAFSASVIPIVAVAAALACRFGGCDWINVALSLAVLVFLQAATDVLSDCTDHERGVDYPGSPNGVTWIHEGRFGVPALRRYGLALLLVGVVLGCIVVMRSTWNVLWIGVAGVAIACGYSFLKYRALGDLAVFVAFTVLPSLGLGVVAVGSLLPETLLIALPPGLLTMAILNANNIRDIKTDAQAGCRTVPIAFGADAAKTVYLLQTFLPYLLVAAYVFAGLAPYAAVGTFLTLPLALRNARSVRKGELDFLDRGSAQLQLLFGVLLAVSFPVGLLGFWWQMSLASLVTGVLAFRQLPRALCRNVVLEVALGGILAAGLWGVFWIGNAVSTQLFGFARGQIDTIYALKEGLSPLVIGVMLLVLIGPAEELFWRGLLQRRLSERLGANAGFALATLCYALVHVFSLNFMLICAAAVCGICWGALYHFFPRHLPAIVLSHALWDVAVFILFPIV